MPRPLKLLIHGAALRANLRRARSLASASRVLAVVKADAYGHGLARVVQGLAEADGFGVACLEEAALLRELGVRRPILLLEGCFSGADLERARELKLDLVVHQEEQLRMLEQPCTTSPPRVWLKINTGMNRLGFPPQDARAAWERLRALAGLAGEPLWMTHLACAAQPEHPANAEQLRLFKNLTRGLPGPRSIANSAALLELPESHADWVRPGLMLYGAAPFEKPHGAGLGLHPAMTLRSSIIARQQVPAGGQVGYGGAWRCERATCVGIVACGYGDGYPWNARAGTPIWINGRRMPLLGPPAMDMLAVALEAPAHIGDPVELWGKHLPVEEVAASSGTITHELLCRMQSCQRAVELEEEEDGPVAETPSPGARPGACA